MQLCAITDRKSLAPHGATEAVLRQKLRDLVEGWLLGGVEFIQIREKDLDASHLRSLAVELLDGMDRRQSRLLINAPPSAEWLHSLAPIFDGVHLAGPPRPEAAVRVREIFAGLGRKAIISMACHSEQEAQRAREAGADLVLFAPVFEKPAPASLPGQGLDALRRACKAAEGLPVFALGGIEAANAFQCVAAGAAGVAGIRLFANGEWRSLKAVPLGPDRAADI